MSDNPYTPPAASLEVQPQAGPEAPPLWNPQAAALWGLMFSPVFSAILHMKNWQALGDSARARSAKMSAWILLAVLIGGGVVTSMMPDAVGNALSRVWGIAVLLGWYYAYGKQQVEFVKENYGTAYPRKGWAVPLLLAVVAVIALMVVLFAVIYAVMGGEGAVG